MQVFQTQYIQGKWTHPLPEKDNSVQLVLGFGSNLHIKNSSLLNQLKIAFPNAQIAGCTTAGEILGEQVFDDSLVVTAISFEHTQIRTACAEIGDSLDSFNVGKKLAEQLVAPDLVHVFVLSDGLHVNGTNLANGIDSALSKKITVTGGLSGDGDRFAETFVFCNDAPRQNIVAAIGLYGQRLQVGYGSLGGWDPFGPTRVVTKSTNNVLFELDGKPALEIYKEYLGPKHSEALPSSALMFPLSLEHPDHPNGLVRTILSVNEAEKSMTFAGDIPENAHVRLMRTNVDHLIDGASEAARKSLEGLLGNPANLSILISCVGRKIVMKQLVDEEVEYAKNILGTSLVTGFYSYGELCPFGQFKQCELHNQTMTITTFAEV